MVEINKRRFMDVKTFLKNEGFEDIKTAANAIVTTLANSARERLRG
jgi:N-formylglutamate deformylase